MTTAQLAFPEPLRVIGRVDHGEELVIYAEPVVTHDVYVNEVALFGDDAYRLNAAGDWYYMPVWKSIMGRWRLN